MMRAASALAILAALTMPQFAYQAPSPPSTSQVTQVSLNVCKFGVICKMNIDRLTQNFNNAFLYASFAFGLAIFLIGAFLMVISAGNDTLLQASKRAMKGSLIGVAIITGSYGIYRTVVYLLYQG